MEKDGLTDGEIGRLAYLGVAMFSRPDLVERLMDAALEGPARELDSRRFRATVRAMTRLVMTAWKQARRDRIKFSQVILDDPRADQFSPAAAADVVAAAMLQTALRERGAKNGHVAIVGE